MLFSTVHLTSSLPVTASAGVGFAAALATFAAAAAFRLLAKERFDASRAALVQGPFRSVLRGVLVAAGVTLITVLLAVSIIGIPLAIASAALLKALWFIGLATGASVLGAMLPMKTLQGREYLQIGAGVAVAYLIGFIPAVGMLFTSALALAGLGALFGRSGEA